MKKFLLMSAVLCASCVSQSTVPSTQTSSSSSTNIAPTPIEEKPQTLEQIPAELSVEHFSKMKLEGTDFTLGDVLDDNAAYTRYTVKYKSNGLWISGILNVPKGTGPFPLLLLNHGYIDPDVYTNGRGLKREQDSLARAGFAVLHSDYRGHAFSDESPDTRKVYDAGLEYSMDVINGLQAIRAAKIPHIDTEHVGMLGHSMGGGVSLNIAVAYPKLIDAMVLYAPVNSDAYENFNRWRRERDEDDRTAEVMGNDRSAHPELWDALSSQTLLKNIDVPIVLFQGTNDKDVPKEWSDGLNAKLSAGGKDIRYVVYQNEGHEFDKQFSDFMRRTANFFHSTFAQAENKKLMDSSRVTLKPFGIKIDKATSPVQPERFSGYHVGTDYEVLPGEDPHSMDVRAICDGTILAAQTVSGYGGAISQRCTLNRQEVTVIYGHLSAASFLVKNNQMVYRNQILGFLGNTKSNETDGERAHLHLGIHKGTDLEWNGYVQSEEQLSDWMDARLVLE